LFRLDPFAAIGAETGPREDLLAARAEHRRFPPAAASQLVGSITGIPAEPEESDQSIEPDGADEGPGRSTRSEPRLLLDHILDIANPGPSPRDMEIECPTERPPLPGGGEEDLAGKSRNKNVWKSIHQKHPVIRCECIGESAHFEAIRPEFDDERYREVQDDKIERYDDEDGYEESDIVDKSPKQGHPKFQVNAANRRPVIIAVNPAPDISAVVKATDMSRLHGEIGQQVPRPVEGDDERLAVVRT